MDGAKIRLSAEEEALITRSDWILTKNNILIKVKKLLESIELRQKEICGPILMQDAMLNHQHPKISKGENYRGLPYLVLDYPRSFGKDDVLAIRTMFWWGHFFSVTLHLAGKFREIYSENLIHQFPLLQEEDFYCCINTDPWEYHYEGTNYLPLSKMEIGEFKKIVHRNSFTKISAKIPLEKWDEAEMMLMKFYRQLLKVIE